MQDSASSHDDLSELERQLAALALFGRVDRDRLMYAAGRRAGQRHLRATQRWLAVTSAGFGAMLAFAVLNPLWSVERAEHAATAIAERPEPIIAHSLALQPERISSDPDANYRLLQQLATGATVEVRNGYEPASTPESSGADSQRDDSRWLLNRYLDDPRTRL